MGSALWSPLAGRLRLAHLCPEGEGTAAPPVLQGKWEIPCPLIVVAALCMASVWIGRARVPKPGPTARQQILMGMGVCC